MPAVQVNTLVSVLDAIECVIANNTLIIYDLIQAGLVLHSM